MIACAGMPKVARWKAENAEKAAETAVENSENQGE